eukprot:TRINITY_DN8019_c0_g1_i2.p2 TRINITY_DN8019_c0_g1~~TRINITY_DN8019_c0_g1_i2.p2  ORF type:complete len:453 (-),score=124.41 TRINITY_DN8019_c0_g1_i2:82-1440(-)
MKNKILRVTLFRNGLQALGGKKMLVGDGENWDDFLWNVAQRLHLNPSDVRVFGADGKEIKAMTEIKNDDSLFISGGEEFSDPSSPNAVSIGDSLQSGASSEIREREKELIIPVSDERDRQRQDEKAKSNQTFNIFLVVSFYFAISIALVLLNKYILSGSGDSAPFPFFVVWFQLLVAQFLILTFGFLSKSTKSPFFPEFEFDLTKAKQTLPVTVAFIGMVVFNNLCLLYVEVSFYQVARSLTILFNIVFTFYLLGQRTSSRAIQACLVVMVGFILGSKGEANFSWNGIIFGVISSLFVSLYSIYVKKAMPVVNDNQWKLMGYNTTSSLILMLPIVFFSGEWTALVSSTHFYSRTFWLTMTLTGVFGYILNIAIYLQIKYTSPLTHNLSGTAKATVQTLLSVWIYKNEITPMNGFGIFLVILGSFLYSHVRYQEMKEEEREIRKGRRQEVTPT